MRNKKFIIIVNLFLTLSLSLYSCKTEELSDSARLGDSLTFSGYKWQIKSSESPVGPGPNPFSNRSSDIWIDSQGRLHMKISQHNGIWYSTEVITEEVMGYGTYEFTIIGDLKNIPTNIVLGLFTWDTESFRSDANSEIDVEFSYWGNDTLSSSLLYSVQPVNFGPFYPERTYHPSFDGNILVGKTTHQFTWTPTLVTWRSYVGDAKNPGAEIASWSFDDTNQPRIKYEGNRASDPVVIPRATLNTNARINLWVASFVEIFPLDLTEREIIIESFKYTPLK